MKKLDTKNPDQLAYAEPPGFDALFYGALALVGVGLPCWMHSQGRLGNERAFSMESGWETALLLLLAGAWLMFTLRALQKAFRRVAFVIDRREKTVRTRSWWPFPPGHARPLESCRFVGISKVAIPGPLASSIPTSRTIISLVDAAREHHWRIAIGEEDSMRTLAEDVARFAGLDVLDVTGQDPVVTVADEAGRPLRQDAPGTEAPRVLPPIPADSKLVVSNSAEGLRVEFLTGNAGCFRLLVCAVIGILSVIVVNAFRAESLNQWLYYPIVGGIAIVFLMIIGSNSMPVRTVLEASVSTLRISRHGALGTKLITVRPDSLRGLQPGDLAFTIRWDTGQWHTLGLSQAEMTWLAAALSDALAAPVVIEKTAGA